MNNSVKLSTDIKADQNIHRVTAVWGFSEAAFGGILHALHIPLTGLFVGGAAVIFITLIAHYSNQKNQILKATLTVILIKALISPYTPLTAYFAVALQGILGYIFFSLIKIEKAAAFLLGVSSLLYSSLQKLIILTVVFGTNLWNSIDEFVIYILLQFNLDPKILPANFSFILIFIYFGIHLIGGIYFGIIASRIPNWLIEQRISSANLNLSLTNEIDVFNKAKRKKKKWWRKPSGIIIVGVLIIFMIISYTSPQFQNSKSLSVLIMLIRAFLITFFWFSVLSPFLMKSFNKIVDKKKFEKASELNSITSLFPDFKLILNYCWKSNSNLKGINRIKKFFSCSLSILLMTDHKIDG